MNQPPGGGWSGGGQPPGGYGQPPGGYGQPPGGGGYGQPPGPGGYGPYGQGGAPNPGPYAGGPGGPPGGAPPTEVLAIVSLISGIVSMPLGFCCAFLGAPVSLVAIITGALALSKIGQQPAQFKGKELAIGGIVTGAVGILVLILALAFGVAGALLNKR